MERRQVGSPGSLGCQPLPCHHPGCPPDQLRLLGRLGEAVAGVSCFPTGLSSESQPVRSRWRHRVPASPGAPLRCSSQLHNNRVCLPLICIFQVKEQKWGVRFLA